MWTRKELKDKAKIAFKANYWKAVLVGLLLAVLLGGFSSFSSFSNAANSAATSSTVNTTPSSMHVHVNDPDDPSSVDITFDDFDERLSISDDEGHHVVIDEPSSVAFGLGALAIGSMAFLVFLVILAVVLALDAFIFNPLEVGAQRFFLRNLNQPAYVKEVAHAFDTNYRETAKGLFIRDLCIIGWSLLLIIPGIVKSYEYRMMPYLFADDPTMTKERAFAESKQMMTGQKWNAFVLDLSFIGWNILSALTLGILGIFYVGPYQAQTNAALYEKLRYSLPAPAPAAAYAPAAGPAYAPQGTTPNAPADQQTYAPYGQQTYAPTGQQTYAPTGQQAYAPGNQQAYAPYGQPSNQSGSQQPAQPAAQPTQPMPANATQPTQPISDQFASPEAGLQPTQPMAAAGAVAPVIVSDAQPPIPPFAAADAPAPVWEDDLDEASTCDVLDESEADMDAELATDEAITSETAEIAEAVDAAEAAEAAEVVEAPEAAEAAEQQADQVDESPVAPESTEA